MALAEVYRVLKPGGKLFAVFITTYTSIRYAEVHFADQIMENLNRIDQILKDGYAPPGSVASSEFVARFIHQILAPQMIWEEGFEVLDVLGLVGLISLIEEEVNKLSGEAWEAWVDLNLRVAADRSIHGCVEHLLVVAEKPRWRQMLLENCKIMNEAKLIYKIVGGALLALHGLHIPVNDIDIEMGKKSVYCFQEMFSKYATRKVSLKKGDNHRSHFEQFNVEGTNVEVMGDLHRLEDGKWRPTYTLTTETIKVRDIPIIISWLEEETLAYLRRGNMERVCMAMKYCDPSHLLSLIRGNVATNVL